MLAGKMKFSTKTEMQAFQTKTKARIADLAQHIALRLREGR